MHKYPTQYKVEKYPILFRGNRKVGTNKFICVESFKNDKQQFNLQCWALTAETIIHVDDWKWIFKKSNYNGDYEFIFFN